MTRTPLTQADRELWGGILNDRVRLLDKLRRENAPLNERIKVQDQIKQARQKLGLKTAS